MTDALADTILAATMAADLWAWLAAGLSAALLTGLLAYVLSDVLSSVGRSVGRAGAARPTPQPARFSAWALLPGLARYRQRRRCARFDAQLPETLSALAAALRAGAALPAALRVIVRDAPAPLGEEFARLLREQRLGITLEDALGNLYARVPTESTGLFVAVLRVARHTGGRLADTLERLAATLRARLHWQGRARALSAQGRLQAWLLAALPPVLLLVLSQLEMDAMRLLWSTPLGWLVLAVIIGLEILGAYWIRRIVAIDI